MSDSVRVVVPGCLGSGNGLLFILHPSSNPKDPCQTFLGNRKQKQTFMQYVFPAGALAGTIIGTLLFVALSVPLLQVMLSRSFRGPSKSDKGKIKNDDETAASGTKTSADETETSQGTDLMDILQVF
jgi:hypothetical protein